MRAEEQARLPLPLKGATTLNQLVRRGGQQWWKRFGSARSMSFDLADENDDDERVQELTTEKGSREE